MNDPIEMRKLVMNLMNIVQYANSGLDTQSRLDEAHAYAQKYLVQQGYLGDNVWHAIFDDAIRMRNKIEELTRTK